MADPCTQSTGEHEARSARDLANLAEQRIHIDPLAVVLINVRKANHALLIDHKDAGHRQGPLAVGIPGSEIDAVALVLRLRCLIELEGQVKLARGLLACIAQQDVAGINAIDLALLRGDRELLP